MNYDLSVYAKTKKGILKALEAPEPQTVRDFEACGLERSDLKYPLIDLETEGLIISRLPTPDTPLRLYELVR